MSSDKPIRTIADIAQLAGVSKSTVSRALSDSPLISKETKERIQAIARQHNFKIHQPARRLTTGIPEPCRVLLGAPQLPAPF